MENEEFRERLGLDPRDKVDIEEIQHKKKVKAEQAAAMNRVLVKEVNSCRVANSFYSILVMNDSLLSLFWLFDSLFPDWFTS